MDIEKGTETLDKADGFLTKLKNVLKKHWGILLLILIGFGVYKFIVAVGEEMDNPTTPVEEVIEIPYEEPIDQQEMIYQEYQTPKGKKGFVEQNQTEQEGYTVGEDEYYYEGDTYEEE